MKVSDLAKQLNVTSDYILKMLKSLRFKSNDKDQELNDAVISVLKTYVNKGKEIDIKAPSRPVKSSTGAKEKEKPSKKQTPSAKSKKEQKEPVKKEIKKIIKGEKVVQVKPVIEPKKKEAKPVRPKTKLSQAPVITLKPLARKRKKLGPDTESRSSFGHPPSTTEDLSAGYRGEESPLRLAGSGTALQEKQEAVGGEGVSTQPLQEIEIKLPITVGDLSFKIQQKSSAVLKELMKLGLFCHINQNLNEEIVNKITSVFGYKLATIKTQEEQIIEEHRQEQDDPESLKPRAPVVTFMGHVDHGKTSLLDKIRKSKIADLEHGGITQHIGAYSVEVPKGRITFLDTPGHEAFTAMRARGAHITDLVVLVIAADEGVMPQTKEAIDHARAANVPIVVALNKIDHKNANIDRVKKQLMELDLNPEDWGGKTTVVGVSALTGEGIDTLLELILLEAELLELKANPNKKASGIVVEAHLSKGKGAAASLIVQSGTLHEGDIVVVGPFYGKVRAMFDDHKRIVKEAGPSMPVEVLGLPDVPEAGDSFYVVEDERIAREISFKRQEAYKNKKLKTSEKITLENLYTHLKDGLIKELNVILKADVQGSLEALLDSLAKIPSDRVRMKFIHTGLGDVNASDVLLAVASKAIIMAFHVGIQPRAKEELKREPVDIREYRIIYAAIDDMKKALEGMLEAKVQKNFASRIEVREVFKLSKHGIVAGCYVTKGKVHRKAHVDVIRENNVIYSGHISSLKRFKDDIRDVNEGMECGIALEGFDKYQPGDIFETYDLVSISQKL